MPPKNARESPGGPPLKSAQLRGQPSTNRRQAKDFLAISNKTNKTNELFKFKRFHPRGALLSACAIGAAIPSMVDGAPRSTTAMRCFI
jgi:hypothetical protein